MNDIQKKTYIDKDETYNMEKKKQIVAKFMSFTQRGINFIEEVGKHNYSVYEGKIIIQLQ